MRASVNRKKGTLCSRNVAYVDRPLYKHYIIEEVIPDIKAKWPASEHGKTIFIQQDNATPRVPVSGPDVVAAGTSWIFASIQCIQYRQQTRGIENLIRAVTEAFEETSTTALDNIVLTLQCVMQCILLNEREPVSPPTHGQRSAAQERRFADRDHV
ncbi:hypothetical protein JG687_00015005 [Phytophthora cactorum]|uniref:Uncharacterized protein n=1 Tax=Phytophthora cactorum TaxID=29920 RepID=A0A8T1TY47_9STRA|nr:hypothetical protein JG687_00015005 [Phytophthora cactorum]